jgi:hypothetical protein
VLNLSLVSEITIIKALKMKKLFFLLIVIAFVSCSTTGPIGNVNNMGSTIEDRNSMAGKKVIRTTNSKNRDEIYYIPLFSHNW